MSFNLRLLAARVINDVTEGRSLSDCLDAPLSSLKDPRDRAFLQALCFGVCRFYPRLDVILSYLLEKPMKAKDSDVHALLMVGLYQLTDMRVPSHAAVAETVNAVEGLKKAWAKGLVNAVLREYLRTREAIAAKIPVDPEALYAHPEWWIDAMKKAWPEQWQAVLNANNTQPPMVLRVNQRYLKRDDYLGKLREHDLVAHAHEDAPEGIVLDAAVPVDALPGFASGYVSVQDGAAQLAAGLLRLAPGQRVLDACAAPGGKLTHILEQQPDLAAVFAVEIDPERMTSIRENLTRLKLQAELICDDVARPDSWWDGQPFDRILLDAPCSASGVVRRHPDIKLLRQPEDIPALAGQQLAMLRALWPLLQPGGLLVYATCSVFPEENTGVIRRFLAEQQDAREDRIAASWGLACEYGRQILPGAHNMDGFYYVCLEKTAGTADV